MVALSTDPVLRRKRKRARRITMAAGLMSFWGRGSSRIMNIMIKKKKKKMMKKMINRGSSNANANANANANVNANANAKGDISNNSNNNNGLDEDFVICEILTRLPVKTLMRFKTACKHWKSSIQHDPQFHQLQFNHSEIRQVTFSAKLGSGFKTITGYQVSDASVIGVSYHTFQQWDTSFSVHGLVCLTNLSEDAVRIYNPSTRQETQWIKRPTKFGRIVFGFDPVTKKHKVLCRKIEACDVLTVGDNTWRRIDHDHQVPNDNLDEGPCVYLKGAIYWMEKICHKKGQKKKRDKGAPEVLVAFDVGSEKFRVIPIPDFIINQPRESYWYVHTSHGAFTDDLLEVNGRVALLRRKNKNTVSMWLFEEADADHNRNWSEVVITLPFDWIAERQIVRFDNVPRTDQIVVKTYIRSVLTAYSHNWKKNTSEKLAVTGRLYAGCPSSWKRSRVTCRCTHFRESLFPVT